VKSRSGVTRRRGVVFCGMCLVLPSVSGAEAATSARNVFRDPLQLRGTCSDYRGGA
jgi:hypothetical protein